MNKRCKLCDGHYNFDSLVIAEYGKEIRVAFTGGSGRADKDNCFKFCPVCGERLTAENFDGNAEIVEEKVDYFELITEGLRDYPEGDIWADGDEILVKTESAADTVADMLETLYKTQDEEILVNTGYYDPEVDERNNEVDSYTGWWYVNIG